MKEGVSFLLLTATKSFRLMPKIRKSIVMYQSLIQRRTENISETGTVRIPEPDDCGKNMMKAASTPEMSVNFYQTTRRNIPEDSYLHARRRENLKSHPV
jgi:hypothetical protein